MGEACAYNTAWKVITSFVGVCVCVRRVCMFKGIVVAGSGSKRYGYIRCSLGCVCLRRF